MLNQLPETAFWIQGQFNGISHFHNLSLVHGNNPIASHYCFDPMGNIDHSFSLKVLVKIFYNFALKLNINIAGRLVQNDYLLITENCPKNSDKLLLARA